MKKLNVKSAFSVLFVAVLLTTFGGGRFAVAQDGSAPECDWNPKNPHKMHWPQLPDLGSAGMDVDMSLLFLADDFKCTATGPINDVHIWASFRNDVLPSDGPDSLTFEITLYSDIPATESSWSMPGEILWSQTFSPGEYSVRKLNDSPEGWYDPTNELYLPNNHRQAYQYNFCIEEEPFIQERGNVYWLSVKEVGPANANYKFGWKTTTHRLRWNDDAVFFLAEKLVSFPLKYPKDHEYMGESLDLAFVITGGEEGQGKHDLGDAPDSSNSFPGATMLAYPAPGVVANYPTVYEIGSPPYGPIHWQPDAFFYLGKIVTNESEADFGYDEDIKNNLIPRADLSDLDGGDDCIPLTLVLPECRQTTFDYTVTVVAPVVHTMAILNVWCDWNRDGDWDDVMTCPDGTTVPEWAVQNQPLMMGPGTLTKTTPPFMCWHPPQTDAKLDPMWMRITIAETQVGGNVISGVATHGGSGPAGGYEYGETEDYLIYPRRENEPLEYDWGDAPAGTVAAGYPTLAFNNGANHVIAGPWLGDENDKPDSEPDGQPDTNALGDDNNLNDDENGVSIPTLIPGQPANITIEVSGGGGIVQAWIDFNSDKTWQAAEQIYNGFLPNGVHTVSFSVPDSTVLGQTFARFRISKKGGLSPEGPARDGEVEDHEVFIELLLLSTKWVQLPDLTENGIDIRVDSSDGNIRTLADDFECRSRSLITDVHLWGSWKDDKKGRIKQIHLSIYSDDPTGSAGQEPENKFSKPGSGPLWEKSFDADELQEALYQVVRDPGEWWWDPVTGEYGPGGDTEVWRIDIYIEPSEAFRQQGSLDNPVIYWLEVQVDTENGEFGWKTRQWPDHYMDDAVWDVGNVGSMPPRLWKELRYPKTHPYHSLEKNSIDMAFQLTYTEEGPPQPTTRPGSATQCPVVETQCPTVPTQCPITATHMTQCPAVETSCPPEPTKCPAVDTECPPEPTQCPTVSTQCPAVTTQCPTVPTQCPITAAHMTQCPAVETSCPPEETKCPAVETECPLSETMCPPERTMCPLVPTQCPAGETYCPPSETKCPPKETECPPSETRCPPEPTKCPPVPTQCPVEPSPTFCPAEPTKCPVEQTKCPESSTSCPPVDTQCPAVLTECPPSETRCPPEPTKCPPVPTQCPVEPSPTFCPAEPTKCPVEQTICPESPTKCPVVPTQCPPVPTQCPIDPSPTFCPEAPTRCPPVPTQCPVEQTICPESSTSCPPVNTQCPAVSTECPTRQTSCPPVSTECPPSTTTCPSRVTECPPSTTTCPVVSTECPTSQTQCPPSTTRCPPKMTECPPSTTACPPKTTECPPSTTTCPPKETECPLQDTRCPPDSTTCPATPSKCPPAPTQCPEVSTKCPDEKTKCPESETNCPMVETKCPAPVTECKSEPTVCPPLKTECPVDPTFCPPVETKCPVDDPTQPCQVTIHPQEPTFCPTAEPTQCSDIATQCPDMQPTMCPDAAGNCELADGLTGLWTAAMGTRYFPVMAQCPAIEAKCPTVVPQLLLAKTP